MLLSEMECRVPEFIVTLDKLRMSFSGPINEKTGTEIKHTGSRWVAH